MKQMIFVCGLMWALAASAEARDWGFSKDTVYEWNPGGDTVWLVNNGSDTLWLDSAFAEELGARSWHQVSFFFRGQHGFSVSEHTPNTKAMVDSVLPGSTLELHRFGVANIVAKQTADSFSLERDALRVRLRFRSTSGEEDTLFVFGTCCGTSIRFVPGQTRFSEYDILGRDVLGRSFTPSQKSPVLIKPSQ
jgi:hypothetical protein